MVSSSKQSFSSGAAEGSLKVKSAMSERGHPCPHSHRGHRGAEGARGIDAKHCHFAGEKAELLQCKAYIAFFRMAFDVGIELRRVERTAQLIAFELCHVDAV